MFEIASLSDIQGWLSEAKANDTHMLVIWDRWDNSDYPVYVHAGQDVREVMNAHDHLHMEKVVEIYNLHMDINAQLAERRAWHP